MLIPPVLGTPDKNLKTIVEEAVTTVRVCKAYAIARERANAAAARMETTKTKMDS
ncbi:hypothetical protein QM042_02345 [Escherichia coli]